MELLLIRHALPVRRELVAGAADPELSTAGQAQAGHLAEYLAAERLDAVYASPLRRAVETGDAGRRSPRARPVVVDDVAEWDRSRREYIPIEELKAANDPRWQALVAASGPSDETPGRVPRPGPRRDRADRRPARRRAHRRRLPRRRDQQLPRPRPRPRSDAPGFFYPNYTSIHRVDGGRHRAALDRHDQRDIAPARHRAADRSASRLVDDARTALARRPRRLPRRVAVAVARRRVGAPTARRGRLRRDLGRASRGTTSAPRLRRPRRRAGRVASSPPATARRAPFRLVGAHTDSPCLRVKPDPDTGARRLAPARRRGLRRRAAQLVARPRPRHRRAGRARRRLVAPASTCDRAVARVPQLAIHLDRDVNERGLVLDTQQHLHPVWGTGTLDARRVRASGSPTQAGDRRRRRGGSCACTTCSRAAVLGRRRVAARQRPARQPGVVLGGDDVAAPRRAGGRHGVDDRPVRPRGGRSASTTGAGGPLLEHVLERLVLARGGRATTSSARSPARRACRPTTPTRCTPTTPSATSPSTGRSSTPARRSR